MRTDGVLAGRTAGPRRAPQGTSTHLRLPTPPPPRRGAAAAMAGGLEPARAGDSGGLEEPEQQMRRPASRPGPAQAGSRAAAPSHTLCSALPAPQAPMGDCGPMGGPGAIIDDATKPH